MLQTTLVCGFGLVVFGLSDFIPIARFGFCMATLLLLALFADLVLLPSLLLLPLKCFSSPAKQSLLAFDTHGVSAIGLTNSVSADPPQEDES